MLDFEEINREMDREEEKEREGEYASILKR